MQQPEIYPHIDEHKRLCDLFSEVWSAPLGLLSLTTLEVLYVTEKLSLLTGLSNDAIRQEKENIFFKLLHPAELPVIGAAHLKTIKFYNKLYRSHNSIPYAYTTYYFKLKTTTNKFENFTALIHPISYSESGFPLISFVLLLPGMKLGYEKYSITIIDNEKKLYFSAISNKYVQKELVEIKAVERQILELTSKGYGETKIAKTLDIKLDLLRYYKKSIYKKCHVANMAEAVFVALHNKIIE